MKIIQSKNKGFTLVELLAVIVILAIIMIIAIPSVLSILQTSKMRAFELFGKKAILETEKKELSQEMNSEITGGGIYVYDIKKDLGLSNIGKYEGYVVVDYCTDSNKEFYLYLKDDTYMIYDYMNSSNIDISKYNTFKNVNKDEWNNKASDKEHASASVVDLVGAYECKTYSGSSSSELNVGEYLEGGLTGSHSAVFLDGPTFNHTMINKVAGNKDYILDLSFQGPKSFNKKLNDGTNWDFISDLSDMTIKSIVKSNNMSEEQKSKSQIVSTIDSPNPIYMWFESGTIYWYTEATKVYANQNAETMFAWLGAITSLDISSIDFSQTTNLDLLFNCDKSITALDVSSMNVRNVTNMTETFYCLQSIQSLDISMWKTPKVKNLSFTFAYLQKATSINFSKMLVNSNVESIEGMFFEDNSVKTLNVSDFDTSNVKNFYAVFFYCESLTSLDLSKWNTSNLTDMNSMFQGCSRLKNLNVSTWDVSKVTDMSSIFGICSNLTELDLSGWHLGTNVNTENMFRQNDKLKTIYTSENWNDKIGKDTYMFANSKALVGGNGTKYTNNSTGYGKTMAVIDGENGKKGYFTRK